MGTSYWKILGEKIAGGLSEKTIRRLGSGGRFLGRAGALVGIGYLFYDFFKNYSKNVEKEPAYQEMAILQVEVGKWSDAISCLGSEPLGEKVYGSLDEGGAINALYEKKVLGGDDVKPADPELARALIARAVGYLMETENLGEEAAFEEKRNALVSRLTELQEELAGVDSYKDIQKELAEIVNEINPIVSGYFSRIYDCSMEIQKTLGSNAAWAAVSMTTLGLLKKPE